MSHPDTVHRYVEAMNHYLLSFKRSSGRLTVEKFEGVDAGRTALRARFAAEAKFAGQDDVELVVIQARSEDEIRRTHSRYFQSVRQLTQTARDDMMTVGS